MPATDDWVVRTADEVIAEAERRHPGVPPTVASGISPSGPVHLGNLRELMTPHLVADEIRRRGMPCRHILSWDDYDRLRKVPAGFDESNAEHVGRPLTAVPDPCGEHPNWAEHFKAPLRESLAKLGVRITEISQTKMYTSGAYADQIALAMRQRDKIGAVLRKYQTKGGGEEKGKYYPFKPYCASCGRDTTTVTDSGGDQVSYMCGCGHEAEKVPLAATAGKLVWKVDWPMRWAYERVTFEPAGVDHASPGSSFTVGGELVGKIFGGDMPLHFGYSFVGTSGSAKLSGSSGGAPTPSDALEIFEPALLRWLYARRRPEQSITLAFDAEVGRIYDEWDALGRRIAAGEADATIYNRAAGTAEGLLSATPRPLPFRTLASVADVTACAEREMMRVLGTIEPVDGLDEVRPRLDCAIAWVDNYVPVDERTQVRGEPDTERLAVVTDSERDAIKRLTEGMGQDWSLAGLTALLYGIPKIQLGLPLDVKPTPELKKAQRAWFVLVYQLLVGRDTGPRLPTLLLALGQDKVRYLLGA